MHFKLSSMKCGPNAVSEDKLPVLSNDADSHIPLTKVQSMGIGIASSEAKVESLAISSEWNLEWLSSIS